MQKKSWVFQGAAVRGLKGEGVLRCEEFYVELLQNVTLITKAHLDQPAL